MNLLMRIGALAAAVLSSAAFAGSSARIQCWTDEQGHRACGNAVPAQYADKEREVLNARGQVVETKSRAATVEETDAAGKADPAGTEARAPAQPVVR